MVSLPMMGLEQDYLEGPFQPTQFWDSLITGSTFIPSNLLLYFRLLMPKPLYSWFQDYGWDLSDTGIKVKRETFKEGCQWLDDKSANPFSGSSLEDQDAECTFLMAAGEPGVTFDGGNPKPAGCGMLGQGTWSCLSLFIKINIILEIPKPLSQRNMFLKGQQPKALSH